MSQRYFARISYVGTEFCGWQKQPHATPSLQEKIEQALAQLSQTGVEVVASGRTDAGVHALHQGIHFDLPKKIPIRNLLLGVNRYLPPTIRILSVQEVPSEFHARKSAIDKTYGYLIYCGPTPLPYLHNYSLFLHQAPDCAAMRKALSFFEGEYDFRTFSASDASTQTSTRTLFSAKLSELPNPTPWFPIRESKFYQIQFRGSGFLKQMVRNMVGTLIEVGQGKRAPESITALINARDRTLAGPTAPAHGLWLQNVTYPARFGV